MKCQQRLDSVLPFFHFHADQIKLGLSKLQIFSEKRWGKGIRSVERKNNRPTRIFVHMVSIKMQLFIGYVHLSNYLLEKRFWQRPLYIVKLLGFPSISLEWSPFFNENLGSTSCSLGSSQFPAIQRGGEESYWETIPERTKRFSSFLLLGFGIWDSGRFHDASSSIFFSSLPFLCVSPSVWELAVFKVYFLYIKELNSNYSSKRRKMHLFILHLPKMCHFRSSFP